MEPNTLGVVLFYYRRKYRITQGELCQGICSIATLSRIEMGFKEVDSLMSEGLLGRFGKEVTRFEIILNDKDYYLWEKRNEIEASIETENYEKAFQFIKNYRKITKEEHNLHLQFCLLSHAKIELALHNDKNDICRMLIRGLDLSKPYFKINNETNYLFNQMEIEIILMLIHLEYKGWEKYEKEELLLSVFKNVSKMYSENQKENIGIRILLALLEIEQKDENNSKIIKYSDKALDFISQSRGIQSIADIRFLKAKAMEEHYRKKKSWKKYRVCCMEECLMAYYVFDLLHRKREKEEVCRFCEDKLEWQITKQEISSE